MSVATRLRRLLDVTFGPPCRFGCGQRVHPNMVEAHESYDHAGDELLTGPEPDWSAPGETFTFIAIGPAGDRFEWIAATLEQASVVWAALGKPNVVEIPKRPRRHGDVS